MCILGFVIKMRRWQSGQLHLTVNQTPLRLRRFESYPAHKIKKFKLLLGLFNLCLAVSD